MNEDEKNIIMITRCLHIKEESINVHFRGAYNGQVIEEVELKCDPSQFEEGRDFVIYANHPVVTGNKLTANLTKSKILPTMLPPKRREL